MLSNNFSSPNPVLVYRLVLLLLTKNFYCNSVTLHMELGTIRDKQELQSLFLSWYKIIDSRAGRDLKRSSGLSSRQNQYLCPLWQMHVLNDGNFNDSSGFTMFTFRKVFPITTLTLPWCNLACYFILCLPWTQRTYCSPFTRVFCWCVCVVVYFGVFAS